MATFIDHSTTPLWYSSRIEQFRVALSAYRRGVVLLLGVVCWILLLPFAAAAGLLLLAGRVLAFSQTDQEHPDRRRVRIASFQKP